ncbi:hypothetical protein HDR58_00365 [bacterium]|nr:hypothetical protein [bacterium]
MKNILLKAMIIGLIAGMSSSTALAVYYQAPNAGNMNFYPLMQHQIEKQETLDFINNPEDYKEKRERKDAQLDYEQGKRNTTPYIKPTSFNLNSNKNQELPEPVPMEFTKDENGQIKIQGIK